MTFPTPNIAKVMTRYSAHVHEADHLNNAIGESRGRDQIEYSNSGFIYILVVDPAN